MSYCFKIAILAEIWIKLRYFDWKIAQRWGFRSLDPVASSGWGHCFQTPDSGALISDPQPPVTGGRFPMASDSWGFRPQAPANPWNWDSRLYAYLYLYRAVCVIQYLAELCESDTSLWKDNVSHIGVKVRGTGKLKPLHNIFSPLTPSGF